MMRNNLLLLIILLLSNISYAQDYDPIITKSIPASEIYFNTEIVDSYQWLENSYSDEAINWVKAQNNLSKKFLKKTSKKTNSFISIDRYTHTKFDYAVKKGNYYFNLYYTSLFSRPSLYYKTKLNKESIKLIEPKDISNNDVINIKNFEVSKDSKYLALQYGREGSDWSEIRVITIWNGKLHKDHLKGVKYSNISWLNDGFFYSTFEQLNKFGKTLNNKVFYHKLGTQQKDDELIFARKDQPLTYFEFLTTSDERFFVIKEIVEKKGKNSIFYIDYKSEKKNLRPIFYNTDFNVDIIDNIDDNFIAVTFKNSNNGKLINFNPEKPNEWKEIAPNYSSATILKVLPFSDRIVTIYQSDQKPILVIYDYEGNLLYTLELPVGSSLGGFSGNKTDKEFLFYLQSYTVPKVIFRFNIETFERKLVHKTGVTFKYDDIVYKRIEYLSKDSIKVPMILVHRNDIKLDGSNPTILKAYGGFGVINSPQFDPGIVHFIRRGGVFAFANIRGGGDKGVKWAIDGKGNNKQNSFDDFISGAEYLIKNKYTNNEKLAITGASNGGLVVAVAAIQRPDLFKVAVPIVAPLDMLKFEKFTVGRFHLDEYGTVTDSLSFNNLRSYSPYHNIQHDFNYPNMLIITSENDDRVPPFHSYKFVAKLQNRKSQTNPILLKVEKNAGHYGSSNYIGDIREKADIYGFILYHLD